MNTYLPSLNVSVPSTSTLTREQDQNTIFLMGEADHLVSTIFTDIIRSRDAYTPQSSQPKQTGETNFLDTLLSTISQMDFSNRSVKVMTQEYHTHYHDYDRPQVHLPKTQAEIEEEKRKSQCNKDIVTFIVGGIIAGISAYLLGQSKAQHENMEQESMPLENRIKHWEKNRIHYFTVPGYVSDIYAIDQIVFRIKAIVKRKMERHQNQRYFLISLVVAASLAMIGAIQRSDNLKTLGLMIGVGGSLFRLYHWGFDGTSQQDKEDASAIISYRKQMRRLVF